MKRIIFITVFYFISFADLSFAQWQPDVRLTNDTFYSHTSENNAWCIASSGNNVYVVWQDERNGNNEIFFKLSTNGGLNWGSDIQLTNDPSFSGFPSIAVSGQNVYVVWCDTRSLTQGIFFKLSSNGGANWGLDVQLTYSNSDAHYPSIAVSEQTIHVVWQENLGSNNYEVYYIRSTNGGTSWLSYDRLTNNLAYSSEASISVFGQSVNIVWHDARDGNYEIYTKHSQDGGASWGTDTRLTNNSAYSYSPSIAMSGQIVHVVWYDYRDGNWEIYYKRSTDGGYNWGTDTRLTNYSDESDNASISVSGQFVHIVWRDYRDGHTEIYYKQSADGGYNWGADTRLTNKQAYSSYPSVTASAQSVHIIWTDSRDTKTEIYYKLNPTGNITVINAISLEIPDEYSLSQNYPNPFNPVTNVQFSIIKVQYVTIKAFDLQGKEVATLVKETLAPGIYEITWNASGYSSGVYFYRMITEKYTATKKMMVVK